MTKLEPGIFLTPSSEAGDREHGHKASLGLAWSWPSGASAEPVCIAQSGERCRFSVQRLEANSTAFVSPPAESGVRKKSGMSAEAFKHTLLRVTVHLC